MTTTTISTQEVTNNIVVVVGWKKIFHKRMWKMLLFALHARSFAWIIITFFGQMDLMGSVWSQYVKKLNFASIQWLGCVSESYFCLHFQLLVIVTDNCYWEGSKEFYISAFFPNGKRSLLCHWEGDLSFWTSHIETRDFNKRKILLLMMMLVVPKHYNMTFPKTTFSLLSEASVDDTFHDWQLIDGAGITCSWFEP